MMHLADASLNPTTTVGSVEPVSVYSRSEHHLAGRFVRPSCVLLLAGQTWRANNR